MDDLHICGAESRMFEADEEYLDTLETVTSPCLSPLSIVIYHDRGCQVAMLESNV
jgi:hypothetical protein